MIPRISIITPTHGRQALLQHQHAIVTAQTVTDFEWLILDDSPAPSDFFASLNDPRIRYHHSAERQWVSHKRNWLCEQAAASVIAQFDDDDYYAPHYLQTMLARLGDADIVKLSAWFVYSAQLQRLGWWDARQTLGLHFTFGPERRLDAFFNNTVPDNMKNNWLGYGFSYVFRKSAWEAAPFPAVQYASDYGFVAAALAKGARLETFPDTDGLCLHILRTDNMSKSFPQYLLPDFMLPKLFGSMALPLLEG
jgi:glycosyltransferase involved in cell wall biosynthesis